MKFGFGECCCRRCLIFEDHLPWCHADDTARAAAGWIAADGLWQHPRTLPKDDWQIVSHNYPLELGVWELQPATAETPLITGVEIRGAGSGDLLARVASIWVTDSAGDFPGLRVTIEDREFDFVYLSEHQLAPASSGLWGTALATDFDGLRFGTPQTAPRPTLCRLAKRGGSVYVEFLRRRSRSTWQPPPLANTYVSNVSPVYRDSVDYPSPAVLDSPVPLTMAATGESAMAIPLLAEWDETFRVAFSPLIRGHEAGGASRLTPPASNVSSRFYATRIGVHGVEPLDAGVSGERSYQSAADAELAGVSCANPGYVAALPPHNELPPWAASLSGFDDCGVHHRHSSHSHGSGLDSEDEYRSDASRMDSIHYRFSTLYRHGRYGQSNLLDDHPSRFHPDAVDLLNFNNVNETVADYGPGTFPDITRDHTGPVAIRRAHITTTLERTTGDDDSVDVLVTVDLVGDGQTEAELLDESFVYWFQTYNASLHPFPGPYPITGIRGLAPDVDEYRSHQRLYYRQTVPRWTGAPPSLTLGPDDLQRTESLNEFGGVIDVDQPIYWLDEYHWSGLDGTYELLMISSTWRVGWYETIRTRGVNVAPLLQIDLTPTAFR